VWPVEYVSLVLGGACVVLEQRGGSVVVSLGGGLGFVLCSFRGGCDGGCVLGARGGGCFFKWIGLLNLLGGDCPHVASLGFGLLA